MLLRIDVPIHLFISYSLSTIIGDPYICIIAAPVQNFICLVVYME